jgi:hypothetical protein
VPQAITARACALCDPAGERPFPSDKALCAHTEAAHGRQLCPICLEVGGRLRNCPAVDPRPPFLACPFMTLHSCAELVSTSSALLRKQQHLLLGLLRRALP